MPKIVLGARPKTLTLPAKFEHLDGTKDAIEVQYIYRTRDEFAAWIDERAKEAGESAAAEAVTIEGNAETMARIFEMQDKSIASHIVGIASGWNLAEPLTLETALQLQREHPAAATAIIQTYRSAIVEGRRGN